MRLDHLVISCETLEEGAAAVEETLGVRPVAGGKHAFMGTHNMLLSLGPEAYLEVIAVDPDAPAPGHARWFALDAFKGPPRLTNWVARCDNLEAALAAAPPVQGAISELSRGALRWRMLVVENGRLPFDGCYPGLIQWQGAHPASLLPDVGLRLNRLTLTHVKALKLRPFLRDFETVRVVEGAKAGLVGDIATPGGAVLLA